MKKLLAALTCLVAVGMSMNIHLHYQDDQPETTGITLANIEALAQGEYVGRRCYLFGSVDCPHSLIKVLYIQ